MSDVIALTETWLGNEISGQELFYSNYIVYGKDRDGLVSQKLRGGGVLIAVNRSLSSEHIIFPGLVDIECMWVRLLTSLGYMYICSVYFPPRSSLEKFVSFYNSVSDYLSTKNVSSSFF